MPVSYFRPSSQACAELDIKKSRFICYLAPVSGRAAADDFVQTIKARHPKANHNCWSYIAGRPDDAGQWNSSDDGEPKGTAGQPMLNILQHSGLGEVCTVVTRYFGGIKLGTGGLVRAYGQAVQEALKLASLEAVIPQLSITLSASYAFTGELEQLLGRFKIDVKERRFEHDLCVHGHIDASQLTALQQALVPVQHKISLRVNSAHP